MENVRKYMSRSKLNSFTIFHENFVGIEMMLHKTPACILELSKIVMHSFYYDYIHTPRISQYFTPSLSYTDTDSFTHILILKEGISELPPPTIYDIIQRDCKEFFNTNDYPQQNIF